MSLIKSFSQTHFKEIFLNGSSTFIFKIVGLVLSYLVIVFITNTFGAESYGRYALMVIFVQVIAMLFTFGFPTMVIRLTSDNSHFNLVPITNYLSKIIQIQLLTGCTIAVLLYFFSEYIAIAVFNDVLYLNYLRIASLLIVPAMMHEIFLGVFKGKKDFKKHNLFLFILPPVLFFVSYVVLNQFIETHWLAFLCFALSILFIVMLETKYLITAIVKTTNKFFSSKIIMKESLPMLYSSFLIYLLGWTDTFMIEGILTSKDVGVYNAAFKVASLGFIIITTINVVISPKIVELLNKKDHTEMHKMIVKSTRLITALTIPIIIAIVLFRRFILGFFGDEFIDGEYALVLISVGVLFSAASGNVDQILNMTNNQKILRNIVLVTFLLNVALNFIFISKYGINGAAAASLITNIVLNGLCVLAIKRNLGFFTFI
jgi:O-antigen/teichoic acid export membrane protein